MYFHNKFLKINKNIYNKMGFVIKILERQEKRERESALKTINKYFKCFFLFQFSQKFFIVKKSLFVIVTTYKLMAT